MTYRILLPLFSFVLFLYGCSKDNSETNTPDDLIVESLQSGNTLQLDQPAIYTSSGVITTPSLVQEYLNRHFNSAEVRNKFYIGKASVNNPGISVTLDLLKSNRVLLNGELMEVSYVNDTLMLASEYNDTDIPYVGNSPCDLLLARVPAITPQSNCPSGTCTKYRKTYPIIISGGHYYLPTLYFGVSNTYIEHVNGVETTAGCSLISPEYPMFNFVQEDLTTSLGAGDTILVQVGRLPMLGKS